MASFTRSGGALASDSEMNASMPPNFATNKLTSTVEIEHRQVIPTYKA
jgi:hypothetical protein